MKHTVKGLLENSISERSRLATPLIGRSQAVAVACSLLARPEVRLLTLTGTGGIGKTRLAFAIGTQLQEDFEDGACFVSLAATHDPDQVIPLIAQTLGLQMGSRPIFESVLECLRPAHLLLILDNFEQVIEAAPVLSTLLFSCPRIRLLVTSRERLRVDGEHEFPLLPLTLPDIEQANEPEELARNPSVMLFLQRVQAIQPAFQLTGENSQTVARICRQLDGLPLALELAAARMKLLTPATLLDRLSSRLRVLTNGARNAPLRQQTLRGTILWSFDLLSPEEQILFRRLGIFVGGCTLEAVEALYSELGSDSASVFDGLTSLLDKSLIQRNDLTGSAGRLLMLETIREFSLEYLQASDEWEQVRLAHARYYLTWAEESRKVLFGGDQQRLLERYVEEQWNWRAAMRLLLEQRDSENALRLVGGLSVFWLVWGYSYDQLYLVEGKEFLEQVLGSPSLKATSTQAWTISVYGGILALLRQLEESELACQRGLIIAREVGEVQYIIPSLWMLLLALITQDDFKAARLVAEEAVALARTSEEAFTDWSTAWLLGYSLHRCGYIALWQGRYTEARQLLEESISQSSSVGEQFFLLWSNLLLGEVDFCEGRQQEARARLEMVHQLYQGLHLRTQTAETLGFLGMLALYRGEIAEAYALSSENLSIRKDVGDEQGIAWAEIWLARVECARHQLTEAHGLLLDALRRTIHAHSRMFTAMGLEALAQVVAFQGEPAWAARLLGCAEALRETIEVPLPQIDRDDYTKQLVALRARLGVSNFELAWSQGRNMSPRQVYTEQTVPDLPGLPPQIRTEIPPASRIEAEVRLLGLTRRERDVLRLLAEGLTNAQIAESLVISLVTVNSYVRSIYSKLAVNTRAAATRYALEHHLI